MIVPDLRVLAQVVTDRLLNTAVEGVVVAGLVCILLRLIGRQNSGTRFVIWFSALLAIVALPFSSGSRFVAPHFRVLPIGALHGQIVLSDAWAIILFAAWMAVTGVLLVRLAVGLWRVQHFRGKCSDVDLARLDPSIAGILRDFAPHRPVKLCVSTEVAVPAAFGFLRPAIVFPSGLLPQLSTEEIKVILLHELAHLRRWDDWTNLAQKIVKAAFFFHPAVWWIENRLTLEREMACDDIVLAQTASPRAYASSLISFAEKLQNARSLALAQALVSRMHQMSLRVAHILDTKRRSRTRIWKPVLGLSAGMLALVFGAAPYMPRFVTFQARPDQAQVQRVRTKQSAGNLEAESGLAAATMARPAGSPAAQLPSPAPRASVIQAAFHPRPGAGVPLRFKTTPARRPVAPRKVAFEQEPPVQETIVILRTTEYDASGASGSAVWTLCIWRVGGRNLAERQLESAIVVGSI
jgi:beta-lactamase regulating signal transducer with metallopeptidase domain